MFEDLKDIGFHNAHQKYRDIDMYDELIRLQKENKLLKQHIDKNDYPLELKEYSESEKEFRDNNVPMFWNRRDWADYAKHNKSELL